MGEHDDRETFLARPPLPGLVPPAAPAAPTPSLFRLGRLVRKELSEILRDRRMIITLVLMPLLLYPLLGMAFPQFLHSLASEPRGEVRIGMPERQSKLIRFYLNRGTDGPASHLAGVVLVPAGGGPLAVMPILFTWREAGPTPLPLPPRFDPLQPGGKPPPRIVLFAAGDLEEAVRSGGVDLGIRLRRPVPPEQGGVDWELLYRADSAHAGVAITLVERLGEGVNAQQQQQWLTAHGITRRPAFLRLLRRPLAESGGGGGGGGLSVSLAALVPLVLILMTITGAVYPAIDLTAGERERGTLEILVATPVPRLALLFAKYVSVVTVAVLTATINLVMMTVTLQVSGLAGALGSIFELSAVTVLQVFGLLLLFAAFFSAVLLMLTSFARSFKEAQAYLIPLMLASLAPGIAGMLPGLELTGVYTVTPLLNIVLLGRDLFAGRADLAVSVVVVFSTLVYALAALAGAARIFGAESVLYSEHSAWSDLFRRPAQARSEGTPAGALVGLALLFPLYYFAMHTLIAPAQAEARVGMQVLVTVVLFVALPLLAACWGRLRLRDAFRLRAPPWLALPAAALLGAGLVLPVLELVALLRRLGLNFLSQEALAQLQKEVERWRTLPEVVVVGSMAVIGAAEELFFRGYLFSALRRAGGARVAILGSAVLFGLFHFAPAFDRLVPSTLMGLVLGWVCWRTGSVLPGMLLHALYDAISALLAYRRIGEEGLSGLPLTWVAAGLAVAGLGAVLIRYGGSAEDPAPEVGSDGSTS